jgi:hypothetical protein
MNPYPRKPIFRTSSHAGLGTSCLRHTAPDA